MTYGRTIGKKFYEDGSVRRYPGNTVVADVTPVSEAYDIMVHLRQMVIDRGFDKTMILLPEDSYHMTVIRGLNDQVRIDTHWPSVLPKDLPMEKVDDHVSAAVASAKMPEKMKMKFNKMSFSATCLIVTLVPADDEQARILKEFRDSVATAIGLFLPKHDEYVFHISLAYTRVMPEGEDEVRFKAMLDEMNEYISNRDAFDVTNPYMAYYDDMLEFSPTRLPRN